MSFGNARPPVATLLYGLLLLAMAAGQISDPVGFSDILGTYEVFGGLASAAAAVIIAAETAAGVGLLASRRVPAVVAQTAGWLGLAVAAAWAALAVQAFVRGLEIPNCGCFGVHLGQRLRWWVLLEDAYMLVLAWFAAIDAGVTLPRPGRRAAGATA